MTRLGVLCLLSACDVVFSGPAPIAPVEVTRFSVAAGFEHTCAIRPDQTLWCWGNNDLGQLGVILEHEQTRPAEVSGGATWARVASQHLHTCGIKTDGSLWCWGYNGSGQLGIAGDSQRAPALVGSGPWKHVAPGYQHTCAIALDGSASCWGDDTHGQLGDDSLRTHRWSTLSSGSTHSCGIRDDDELWCWGTGLEGELGTGTVDRSAPVRIGSGYQHVTTGQDHTCALGTNQRISCWGDGSHGQLGNGLRTGSLLPVVIDGGSDDWVDVVAGHLHTCGRKLDGSLWCWGLNNHGAAGSTLPENALVPTRIDGDVEWTDLALGRHHTCGTAEDGVVRCMGLGGIGQLGDGRGSRLEPTFVGNWNRVYAGGTMTCARDSLAGIRCWGANMSGQLGTGDGLWRAAPDDMPIRDRSIVDVDGVGERHVCVIESNTGIRWCWGANEVAQLGIAAATTATNANPLPAPTNETFLRIAASAQHTCGATAMGTVLCWGTNGNGQVGRPEQPSSDDPVRTPRMVEGLNDVASVVVGARHSCVLHGDARVKCWGDNSSAQLGRGIVDGGGDEHRFVKNPDQTDVQLAGLVAGGVHNCGLIGGTAYCWGGNLHGQLGTSSATAASNPTRVATSVTFQADSLSLGLHHSCGVGTDAELYCWGRNVRGQLGDGTFDNSDVPKRIGEGPWSAVSAGKLHTCAQRPGGDAFCWGENAFGQIGDGAAWRGSMMEVGFP